MAQLNFNARTVDPSAVIDPIPAAWYIAAIDQSEMKPTGDGQGAYLEVRYNVLDGQYVGRKVFARFNLSNNNQKAVEIAYQQLSAVCHATGVLDCVDSQMLHGIPHKIKVTLRPGGPKLDKQTGQPTGENYEPSNEIRGWKGVNEPTDTVAAAPANAGFPAGPAQAAAPQGWGAPAQSAPQQQWAPQQQQQPVQQPAPQQQPAQPWQQGAAAPTVAAGGPPQGSQPWAQQPQQPQQPAVGAPAQPWQQQAPQAAQQPVQGAAAPWSQQPAQGGNLGTPAAGGAQPPWAR